MPDVQQVARGLRERPPPGGHAERVQPVDVDPARRDGARRGHAAIGEQVDDEQREDGERKHLQVARGAAGGCVSLAQRAMTDEHAGNAHREQQQLPGIERVEKRTRRIRGKEEAAAEIDQREERQRERENESGDHAKGVGPAEAGPHDNFRPSRTWGPASAGFFMTAFRSRRTWGPASAGFFMTAFRSRRTWGRLQPDSS